MQESTGWIQIQHQFKNGLHTFTSPDIPGLYVTSEDLEKGFEAVPSSIRALLVIELQCKPEEIVIRSPLPFNEFRKRATSTQTAKPTYSSGGPLLVDYGGVAAAAM